MLKFKFRPYDNFYKHSSGGFFMADTTKLEIGLKVFAGAVVVLALLGLDRFIPFITNIFTWWFQSAAIALVFGALITALAGDFLTHYGNVKIFCFEVNIPLVIGIFLLKIWLL